MKFLEFIVGIIVLLALSALTVGAVLLIYVTLVKLPIAVGIVFVFWLIMAALEGKVNGGRTY